RHWQFFLFAHIRFRSGHVEYPDLPRCCQIADGAALQWSTSIFAPHGKSFLWIFERQQTTGEISASITLQFQRDGFSNPLQPDFPSNCPALAIVNLAANNIVMNAPSHDG